MTRRPALAAALPALLAAALAGAAPAGPAPKRIAVLRLEVEGTPLDAKERDYYTDLVRGRINELVTGRIEVITNENLEEIMRGNGLDPAQLCPGDCAVKTGRDIGADFVVTGQFTILSGQRLNLRLQLHETQGAGQLLNSANGDVAADAGAGEIKGLVVKLTGDLVSVLTAGARAEEATSGELYLVADPPDASYEIDGTLAGQLLPGRKTVLTLPAGKHRLLVRSKGFQDDRQDFFIEAGLPKTVRVALLAPPPPAATEPGHAYLTVVSKPDQARIFLDGKDTGKLTPFTFPGLGAGEHEVLLQRQLYLDRRERIRLTSDEFKTQEVTLEPNFGMVDLKSEPPGATIYLDGEQRPEPTPLILDHLEAKAYRVRLSMPLYETLERTVVVERSQRTTVSEALRPRFGTLDLRPEPAGATVYLDGVQISGVTPMTRAKMEARTYRVRLTLPLYRDLERTLTVEAGKTAVVEDRLQPKFGSLKVIAETDGGEVQGAEVWLSGVKRGAAPLLLERLLEGTFPVEVRAPLHRSWTGEARVVAGEDGSLSARLVPEYGILSVHAEPDGLLFVDGEAIGAADGAEHRVRMGSRRIEITPKAPERYRPFETVVVVEVGKTERLRETLAPRQGSLVVVSNPPGATVWHGVEEVGVAPMRIPNVFVGPYALRLEQEMFLDWTGEPVVVEGTSIDVVVDMKGVDIAKFEAELRERKLTRARLAGAAAGLLALMGGGSYALATRYASDQNAAVARYQKATDPSMIAAARSDEASARSSARVTQGVAIAAGALASTALGWLAYELWTAPDVASLANARPAAGNRD